MSSFTLTRNNESVEGLLQILSKMKTDDIELPKGLLH